MPLDVQYEICVLKKRSPDLRLFGFVLAGGTWWASRALWWATSLSPSTSPASSWAACITLIISPEPCTSGSLTSKTCPSNSPSTAPCSAVRQHHTAGSHFHSQIIENGTDVKLYYHLLDGQFPPTHLQFPHGLMNYWNLDGPALDLTITHRQPVSVIHTVPEIANADAFFSISFFLFNLF